VTPPFERKGAARLIDTVGRQAIVMMAMFGVLAFYEHTDASDAVIGTLPLVGEVWIHDPFVTFALLWAFTPGVMWAVNKLYDIAAPITEEVSDEPA